MINPEIPVLNICYAFVCRIPSLLACTAKDLVDYAVCGVESLKVDPKEMEKSQTVTNPCCKKIPAKWLNHVQSEKIPARTGGMSAPALLFRGCFPGLNGLGENGTVSIYIADVLYCEKYRLLVLLPGTLNCPITRQGH